MNFKYTKHSLSILFILATMVFLPGCFRTRSEIARENEDKEVRSSLQRTVYEQNKGLEELHEEMGRLEGRIEELEHNRKREQGEWQNKNEGAQKTIAELNERVAEMQKNQEALFEELKKIREDSLNSAQANAPDARVKKKVVVSFEDALADFKGRDFSAAADSFQDYLEKNPKSKKTLEARYYLGESLFQLKEYSEAIAELGFVHEKNPSSPLGRKSTLRIAESFKALGKDKDAKAFAQILVEKSPGSAEAKAAKRFLR